MAKKPLELVIALAARKKMSKGGGVKSPKAGHTIKQLQNLKQEGWHNADTGYEMSEEEGEAHLQKLIQKKADREEAAYARKQMKASKQEESDEHIALAKGGKVVDSIINKRKGLK